MENQKQLVRNKRGQSGAIEVVLTGFTIIAAVLVLLVLLIYTFGTVYIGLESTAETRTVTNESDFTGPVVFANRTGFTIAGFSSTGEPRNFVVTSVFNSSSQGAGNGGYNITVPTTNVSISSLGVLNNATNAEYTNISLSYTYLNNSASQTASRDAGTNTSRAIPIVGILFIILAVGALITILIISLMGSRRS